MTRIMVAEDNTHIFSCYQNFLSKDKTIEIVGHALDGESAVDMYIETKPDILILDLKLPKKNGLEILNDLTIYERGDIKCNVIVVSGDLLLRHKLFNTRKVFRVIPKPISYDLLQDSILECQREQIANTFSVSKCQDLLLQLRVNPISKNGRLLTEAIKLCYCNAELLDSMQNLYSILAIRKSCSPDKIKYSIRSIIETANKFANSTTFNSIFYIEVEDINKGVSPKHFFNGIVIFLKNNKKAS